MWNVITEVAYKKDRRRKWVGQMILEFKVDELSVQGAWLKTLYDLIEELNCKCQTFMEEKYNTTRNCFGPIRVVKISGSETMLGWLKLRMERYNYFIDSLSSQVDISSSFIDDEEI